MKLEHPTHLRLDFLDAALRLTRRKMREEIGKGRPIEAARLLQDARRYASEIEELETN
jgi:hypothetical protein